jgi:hypothetical protein
VDRVECLCLEFRDILGYTLGTILIFGVSDGYFVVIEHPLGELLSSFNDVFGDFFIVIFDALSFFFLLHFPKWLFKGHSLLPTLPSAWVKENK